MTNADNTYRTLTPYLVVPDADGEIGFLNQPSALWNLPQTATRTILSCTPKMQIGDSLLMLGQGRAELESASGGVDSGALSIMVLLQTDSCYI